MGEAWVRTSASGDVDGIPVWSVELERGVDMIDVTTIGDSIPDPGWEFRDPAGHYHAWTKDGKLPTLDLRLKEHVPCEDMDECGCGGTDVTANYCRICGAEVDPVRMFRGHLDRQYMAGRSWWRAVVRGAHLVRGYQVTVRFQTHGPDGVLPHRSVTLFGVARVMGTELRFDEPAEATLEGIGELGER